MNDALIEELLNEDESSSLDFKRDQYPFDAATNEQKSELIKDIIAFANAWRRSDAYILIGVDEVKGGRSKVIGVQYHLNESNLQQLVNSKTQLPVFFSYQAYEFDGTQIGIITIPIQERPIYLKKDFGRLQKETVYIRRGSSTDEAKPDEIARMGAAAVADSREIPALNLQFADIDSRIELGNEIIIKSTILEPPLNPDNFKLPAIAGPWQVFESVRNPSCNPNYYKELIEYTKVYHKLNPIGFIIDNNSGELAIGVQLKAKIDYQEGIIFINEYEYPDVPTYETNYLFRHHTLPELLMPKNDQLYPKIEKYSDHWELTINFGKVLPKSKVWSEGILFVGSRASQTLNIEAELYAENLPKPTNIKLLINIDSDIRPMEKNDLTKAHPRCYNS